MSLSRACPDVCGRRCKKRFRVCQGPYEDACTDGKPEELSSCAALNISSTTSVLSPTTEADDDDDEYSMNMDEYGYDDDGGSNDDNNKTDTDKNEDNEEEEEDVDEDKDKNQAFMKNGDRRFVRKRRLRKVVRRQ